MTTTPTTTAETITPTAGIAQAPAAPAVPSAEAGKQKVKRLTGTVTRVE